MFNMKSSMEIRSGRLPCKPLPRWTAALLLVSMLLAAPAEAEPSAEDLDAAEQLLRVADIGNRFEFLAQQQAQQIIYNYGVIVQRTTDYRLPLVIERRIADCYQNVYRWEFFAEGIAHIVAENFSGEELALLIDFHRNLGLPPNKIDLFRSTTRKASVIRQQSIDYIFANSASCVDQDAELIIQHLINQQVL